MRTWIPLDWRLAQIGLLVTVLGLWLGALSWLRPGRALDRGLFRAINRLPVIPALDWLMWTVTHLGSAWCGIATLTFALFLQRPRFGLVTALAILTVGLVIGVTKSLTRRPRPFTQLAGVRVVGLKPADLSYPSGHSTLAFTVATLLSLGLPLHGPWPFAAYALAGAVAYSRLHLGVHYPLDILSGATIGTGWGMLWVSYLYR